MNQNNKHIMYKGETIPIVWNWYKLDDRDANIPGARSLLSCVPLDNKLYIFGGYDGISRKNDFYSFDTDKLVWKKITTLDIPPQPRDRHVSVVYKRSIYIFGGYDGFNRVNDFFEYNADYDSWQEVIFYGNEGPPSPRHSHSAVVYEDSMYVFGGYDGNYKNDLYKFNFTKNEWSKIKPTDGIWPTPRYRTSCTVIDDKMFMFGGHDGQQQLNDFYYYNFKTLKWNQINYCKSSEPSPRDSHVLVHSNNSILLFGGSSGSARSDFFQFKINEGEWKPIKHNDGVKPSCRFCHVGAVVNNKLYIFGGYDGKSRLNDFYFFVISKEGEDTGDNSLTEDLAKFVNNEQYSDVILKFPEEESSSKKQIFAHRILLSKCPYFEKIIDEMGGYDEDSEEVHEATNPIDFDVNVLIISEISQRIVAEDSPEDCNNGESKDNSETAEEENEIIDDSKDDVEITETSIRKDYIGNTHETLDKFADEEFSVDEYKSDDEETVELPLIINIPSDISYDTGLDIIKYIYTDYGEVLLENAMQLLKAANIFGIEKLKVIGEQKISSSISIDNVAQILMEAHETNSKTLKEISILFIIENFDVVSKTNAFLQMVTMNPVLAVEVLKRR